MQANDKKPLQILFYTKSGCPLCDEARDVLDEIASEIDYELTEIDIRKDLTIFATFRYRIPVISINGTHSVEGRIEYDDLIQAIEVAQNS